jgi:anti-sigma regulatory factor (Ser/Thr protein kinase)
MNGYAAKSIEDHLVLESKLSELNRIPPWVENLASLHAIPDRTRYAMDLCLEEVLSNIVRHGYKSEANGIIRISCLMQREGCLSLVVEDGAPAFNPLIFESRPFSPSLGEVSVGGQGIHLLKEFADKVDYEAIPTGNRLTFSFTLPGSSPAFT